MNRVVIPLLMSVALLTGCREECDPATFEPHCSGNVARTCPEPGVDQIVGIGLFERDCGDDVCVEAGGTAFCALSAEPEALCTSLEEGEGITCSGPSRLRCRAGYGTSLDECFSCEVDEEGFVTCAGGTSSRCTTDEDCIPSHRCKDNGFCTER